IFNPGSENKELADILRDHNIEVVEACTLVMLSTGQY
ncbi:MAG: CoA-binding protein, partial [Bacteroidetes bacterium]|nr:CoA-binding protein [Bacteroidota bacterium]